MSAVIEKPKHVHEVKQMGCLAKHWFIARPQPLLQGVFVKNLLLSGIEYFNPMVTTSRRCGRGGMRVIHEPFLRGYVPIRLKSPEERTVIERTPGFLQLMRSGPERFVVFTDYGINLIARLTESTVKDRKKLAFEIGDQVRVIEGPFASFPGIVEELPKEERRKVGAAFYKIKVAVNIFGRSTPLELESWQVEKA